jgi:hypothetical protein
MKNAMDLLDLDWVVPGNRSYLGGSLVICVPHGTPFIAQGDTTMA